MTPATPPPPPTSQTDSDQPPTNGVQSPHGVEAEGRVIVLQLINENGDRIQVPSACEYTQAGREGGGGGSRGHPGRYKEDPAQCISGLAHTHPRQDIQP